LRDKDSSGNSPSNGDSATPSSTSNTLATATGSVGVGRDMSTQDVKGGLDELAAL
ncbi:hypothetical protein BGZ76_005158, partial [Entomortierella beljakovae]